MKKVFTITILSLMAILTIVNSCSKSSDSSTTPTPTPTTATVDTNTLVIDGTVPLTVACPAPQCNPGSANIFTMFMVSNDNQKQLTITTLPQPTASGTYTLKPQYPAPPYPTSQMQISYTDNSTTPSVTYTAQTGTATVTVVNSFIKVAFSKISFVKTGKTDVVISGCSVCQ